MRLLCIFVFVVGGVLMSAAQDDPKGLFVNQLAPTFSAKDQNGKTINLESLLRSGPVVLVFYRGQWCPYCSKHLKVLEDSLSFIQAKGARVITVTPERPEYIAKTIEQTNASFSIIHDAGLSIMKSYGVLFRLADDKVELYKKYDLDFTVINGDNGPNLPVPALYIIGKDRKISYRYFDANYKNRPTVKQILENL